MTVWQKGISAQAVGALLNRRKSSVLLTAKVPKTRHLEFLLRLVVHPTASRRISHVA